MKNLNVPKKTLGTKVYKIAKIVAKISLAVGFVCTLSGGAYLAYLIREAKKKTPTGYELYAELQRRAGEPTYIRDNMGVILAAVSEKNEYDVPIDQMNPYLVAALIATEDKRIREHTGFDERAIWGMIRDNLRGYERGGSTLSSQIFKESPPKRVSDFQYLQARGKQKIEERVKAEKLLSLSEKAKWFVLEWYLNNMYFVTNERGIAAASLIIFGKEQDKLTIDEAALLVGLAQNPVTHNPLSEIAAYRRAAEGRTDEVLHNLLDAEEDGVFSDEFKEMYPSFAINESEIEHAIALPTLDKVVTSPTKVSRRKNLISGNTFDIIARAEKLLYSEIGYQDDQEAIDALVPGSGRYKGMISRRKDGSLDTLRVRDGGFNIITTLRSPIQDLLEKTIATGMRPLDRQRNNEAYPLDAAFLCVDNATGQVLGEIRGRNWETSKLDFLHARTEQGSIMKSVVLAGALELGIIGSLEEIYRDTAITLTHHEYPGITSPEGRTPQNFGGYSGDEMSIGKAALVDSRNTAIVHVFKQAAAAGRGQDLLTYIYETLEKLTPGKVDLVERLQESPQIGLGLLPADMDLVAAMYMALANGGTIPQYFTDIAKIEDLKGGLLYEQEGIDHVEIYPPEICTQLMPYLLEKGKNTTSYENVLVKSGTTDGANKLRIALSTSRFTLVLRVGPHEYADARGNVLGWKTQVHATGLLGDMVKKALAGMEKLGLYDPHEAYPSGNN